MTAHRLARRIAAALVNHAVRALPAKRVEWARAMSNEVNHIAHDFEALRWALGCVLASYSIRMNNMTRSRLHVARWLLGFEILVFLGPLTLLWLAAMYILLLGEARTASILVPTIIGTLGPIGLLLGLRVVALRRSASRASFAILAASFAAVALLQLAKLDGTWFAFDWRVVMLNSILPGIACAHLTFMSDEKPTIGALQASA